MYPRRIGDDCSLGTPAAQLRQGGAGGQPQQLPPRSAGAGQHHAAVCDVCAQQAFFVKAAAGGAAQLAAGGFEHRVRCGQHHFVGRLAQHFDAGVGDRLTQRGQRGGRSQPRLGQHDQALGAAARIGAAEHRDAALAHTGERTGGLFEFVRINVAPAANDDVLDAAGEIDIACGHVGAVAAVEPRAVKQRGGLARVAKVTRRGRWPLEFEAALGALARFKTGVVDDAHLMPRQGPPARDEAQRVWIIWCRRARLAVLREARAVDAVNHRAAPGRRHAQTHRGFGQAIHRGQRARVQTVRCKARGKSLQRGSADRLGTVGHEAQRRQVKPVDLSVRDALQAQLVGKVGRGGEGAAMTVHRPQPALWMGQKCER